MAEYECRRLLADLERKGLLYLEGEGAGARVHLHDLQRDFLQIAAHQIRTLHVQLLEALARVPFLANLLPHLIELKVHAWSSLNSFVHAGVHALSRSRDGFPTSLAINVIRMSNNMSMMAGQHLAILTGIPDLQKEVLRLNETYAGCLLFDEEKRRVIREASLSGQSSS